MKIHLSKTHLLELTDLETDIVTIKYKKMVFTTESTTDTCTTQTIERLDSSLEVRGSFSFILMALFELLSVFVRRQFSKEI